MSASVMPVLSLISVQGPNESRLLKDMCCVLTLQCDLAAWVAVQLLLDGVAPVLAVAQQPQIRQGLFRGSHLGFLARQQIAKVNEKLSVALSLKGRQRHDAGQVVVQQRLLFLG